MRIRSKIAGVTASNDDGLGRQEIIRRAVKAGMALVATPEPKNPHDPDAIGLWINGKARRWKVGYIKSGLASELTEYLDDGGSLAVRVLQVTGGGPGLSYGVNIEITVTGIREDRDDDGDLDEDDEDERPRRRGGRRSRRRTATIEATGKGWKGLQALGCLGTIAGFTTMIIGVATINRAAAGPSPIGVIGALVMMLGLPVYLFGRVGAWWYHG